MGRNTNNKTGWDSEKKKAFVFLLFMSLLLLFDDGAGRVWYFPCVDGFLWCVFIHDITNDGQGGENCGGSSGGRKEHD